MDPFSQMGLNTATPHVDSPKIGWKMIFGLIVAIFVGGVIYSVVQAALGNGDKDLGTVLGVTIGCLPFGIIIGQYLWKTRGQTSEDEVEEVEEEAQEPTDPSEQYPFT